MKTKIIYLVIIASISLLTTSCKKRGCTDPDAETYDVNAKDNNAYMCKYRYLNISSTVDITYCPFVYTDNTAFGYANGHTVFIKLIDSQSGADILKSYGTNVVPIQNDHHVIINMSNQNLVRLTRKNIRLELWDTNFLQGYTSFDKLVATTEFNVFDQGANGNIALTAQNGCALTIQYIIQ